MRNEITVTVRMNAQLAIAWVAFVKGLRMMSLVSDEQGLRLAEAGARRLIFVKVGDGRWQWLRP